jgi:hypothetical protein
MLRVLSPVRAAGIPHARKDMPAAVQNKQAHTALDGASEDVSFDSWREIRLANNEQVTEMSRLVLVLAVHTTARCNLNFRFSFFFSIGLETFFYET